MHSDKEEKNMNVMRRIAIASLLTLIAGIATAQQPPAAVPATAPEEPGAIALYPDSKATAATEQWVRFAGDYAVRNVTRPTLTPFLPKAGKATGEAVIVAPGGAFMLLAMDLEGWSVARALADRGIAAFVLKYRLNETPADQKAFDEFAGRRFAEIMRLAATGEMVPDAKEPRATEDALAALKLVRANAKRWGVDPSRVGMMGFSAGAMTALNASLAANAADRPAFAALIYPPMKPVEVPADAPPMFAAIAIDDEMFGRQGFALVESWHKANRPVELHAYERGGHGFGVGRPGTTTVLMLDEFMAWLQLRNSVPPPRQ
jgi:acetyl esterase/lipase